MLPNSRERVPAHTAEHVNEKIMDATLKKIEYYADHPEEIDNRLMELEREWDIERTIQANAAVLSLTGLALGRKVDRRWYIVPGIVAGFLLQHAVQGWCPPVPILRRLGKRTVHEIELERYSLKYLRGDFGDKPQKREGGEAAREAYNAAGS